LPTPGIPGDREYEGTRGHDSRMESQAALAHLFSLHRDDVPATDLTDENRAMLAGFNGWSGVHSGRLTPLALINRTQGGAEWVKSLDYRDRSHLSNSIVTSFYTPAFVIDAMWQAVKKAGFDGGQILEPSVGSGKFIGHSGGDTEAYQFHTVDMDPLATAITQRLYPDARVATKRFEDYKAPDNSFDLAISNVPFDSSGTISDGRYSRQYSRLTVHDYYFLRSMDMVRPGGMVAFITSYGTMDKQDSSIRRALADQANLVSAFRLPSGAMDDTQAGCDIILLQKRTPDMDADPEPNWIEASPWVFVDEDSDDLTANHYWRHNPSHVIPHIGVVENGYGKVAGSRVSMYERDVLATLAERLVASVPANIYRPAPEVEEPKSAPQPRFALTQGQAEQLPAGCHVLNDDGQLCTLDAPDDRDDDGNRRATLTNLSRTMTTRLSRLVPVRDAVLAVLSGQSEGCTDSRLERAQSRMSDAYAAFTKKHGAINRPSNIKAVRAEPYAGLLLSLEDYDREQDTATKTAVFTQRTVSPAEPPSSADTVDDALAHSLNGFGGVDLDYMAGLLGDDTTADDVLNDLGDRVFRNPATQRYETREHYLSGNVKDKLEKAEAAADLNPQYEANVQALTDAYPDPLTPSQITMGLGSRWIPSQIYGQFFAELAGITLADDDVQQRAPVTVRLEPSTSSYIVDFERDFHPLCRTSEVQNWSTDKAKFSKVCDAAINHRTMEFREKDSSGNSYVDVKATRAANTLTEQMRDRFERWALEDPARSEYLTDTYNRNVNIWVQREYDGSHLTFPGLSAAVSPRPHQINFAWRVIESGNSLAAHVVGAGKTGATILAAMESKRLGLANKPMFSVPKQVLLQFASEINRFYPNAQVLVIGKDDLHKDRRKQFFAKVATHNWDAVMITHDAFSRVPMSPQAQMSYVTDQIVAYENALSSGDVPDGVSKDLRKKLKSLESKMETLQKWANDDTGTVFFEHLGVDMLIVDEAHNYKNLTMMTNMARTPGVNTAESKRASDLHMKTTHIMAKNGEERGVVFATGTPISNTMTEAYTMSRYLSPNSLEQMGLDTFDAWASQFARVQTQLERSPDGAGYRMHGRLSKFVNVPELVKLFRHVADVKMQSDLNLPVPRQVDHEHVIEPDTFLTAYMRSLAFRASHAGDVDERDNDNILSIGHDGRLASLDLRTLSEQMASGVTSKLEAVVEQICNSYTEHHDTLGVNVVFCDQSVPNRTRWSFYDACRDRLLESGIPAEDIAFIHDADSDQAKDALFESVRAGRTRVVFGSTQKMGTGVNLQTRVTDMHDVDPPWRPSDLEQRHGRGVRQGNMNDTVNNHYYVTKDSYDEFMLGAIRRKADFIATALTSPDAAQRSIEEQADPEYAELMAISTGNPMIKEKVELEAQREALEQAESQHNDQRHRQRRELSTLDFRIGETAPRIDGLAKDIATADERPNEFVFEPAQILDGSDQREAITDRNTFGHRVIEIAKNMDFRHREKFPIGHYAGMVYSLRSGVSLNGGPLIEIVRDGAQPSSSTLTNKPAGVAAQVTHLHDNMAKSHAKLIATLDTLRGDYADMQSAALGPFPQSDELSDLHARLAEVNTALTEAAAKDAEGQSYPPQIMAALGQMMSMTDHKGRALVPYDMMTPDERKEYMPRPRFDLGDGMTDDDDDADDVRLDKPAHDGIEQTAQAAADESNVAM
jgi:N12 class adenine-specific DNA methylase